LEDSLGALENLDFSPEELQEIDKYAAEGHVNIWARSSSV
jgi:L-glyceraldehyde 3-phosphate reductase